MRAIAHPPQAARSRGTSTSLGGAQWVEFEDRTDLFFFNFPETPKIGIYLHLGRLYIMEARVPNGNPGVAPRAALSILDENGRRSDPAPKCHSPRAPLIAISSSIATTI